MKLRIFITFFFIIFSLASFAEVSGKVRSDITQTMESYLGAFREGSIPLLREAATDEFIKKGGTVEEWAQALESLKKKYKGVSLGEVTIVKDDSREVYYVQYKKVGSDGRETGGNHMNWFVLEEVSGEMKITNFFNDFVPNEKVQ